MSLVYGAIVPHPPIIIPEVGGVEINKTGETIKCLQGLADDLLKAEVDILLFTSPHSPYDYDAFLIDDDGVLKGTLANFGHPELSFEAEEDGTFRELLLNESTEKGIPLLKRGIYPDKGKGYLDHGIAVPYYYISRQKKYKLISVSISGLSLEEHFELGKTIDAACRKSDSRIAFVASGDLSHGLTEDAPMGLAKRGREFDSAVVRKVKEGKISELKDLDPDLIANAGECGLRSFVILAGALEGRAYESEVKSYEGPFGVGYMVAEMVLR